MIPNSFTRRVACFSNLLATILIAAIPLSGFAQQISINSSLTPEELVQDYLVQGCVEVSNITSSVNGLVNNINSFGAFNAANTNFPLTNGIVIATGNVNSISNPQTDAILNEGETSWDTHPEFENATGIANTYNATSIEFDFVSITNQVQFNYILASEEYGAEYLCNYADAFAFLIKEAGSTGPYTNVTVVPNTNTPVSTNSIHAEIFGFCPPENETYFAGYNQVETNFDGRTTVLTAQTSITPYVTYHIKLIVAEQFDPNYDTAVFIAGNSFSPTVNLGDDYSTCDSQAVLNANIGNNQATYQWYYNGAALPGQTNEQLITTDSGNFAVEINIDLNGETCTIGDSININLNATQEAAPISDFFVCDDATNNGMAIFDLTLKNNDAIQAVPPGNYTISYHYNLTDAENNSNPITNPITNTTNPQTIYVRLEETNSGCLSYAPINLIVNSLPIITQPTPLIICDEDDDGYTNMDLSIKNDEITNAQTNLNVSYYPTLEDVQNGTNPLNNFYTNTSTPTQTIYVGVSDMQTGCVATTSLELQINTAPEIDATSPIYLDACDTDHDGFATFNLTEVIDQITLGNPNVTCLFYESLADAQTPENEINNATAYNNIVIDEQVIYIRVIDNQTGCASIRPFEIHSNLLLTETEIEDRYVCDIDDDGIEDFFLNNYETSIIDDLTFLNLNVTFFLTEEDMLANQNALNETEALEITTQTSPITLYISIESETCIEYAEFNVILHPITHFNSIVETHYCDTNSDAETTVDLNTLNSLVTFGDNNYQVNYYLTQQDALNQTNALPRYYFTGSTTLYTAITENETGCVSNNSFNLIIDPAPEVTAPADLYFCDTNSDGFLTINLETTIPEMVADPSIVNIQFFELFINANNNQNAIANPTAFNTNTQRIFARIEGENTCYSIVGFDVYINALPELPENITDYLVCDPNNSNTANFIFNTKDTEIINGQANTEVFYFETLTDAENNQNAIDKNIPYTNQSNPQTIYVRLQTSNNPDCYTTGSFQIKVSPSVIYNTQEDYVLCDDDGTNDGFREFDFNLTTSNITENSPQTLTVTYHLSNTDAQNSQNQIPLLFTNTEPNQRIFARVENQFGCFAITEFGLNVILVPEITPAEPLSFCDDNTDGQLLFDLTTAQFEILDIRQEDLEISYFENESDLNNQENPITNPTQFSNSTNPQTVFISVYNTVTNCFAFTPLLLTVNALPEVIENPIISICDNLNNTYNLSEADSLFTNQLNQVSISYYNSLSDAENATNTLNNIYNYQTNSDQIFVRIEDNSSGCFSTTSFLLEIIEIPVQNPIDFETCDTDFDNTVLYNLQQQTNYILSTVNAANYTVSYHLSETEAQTNQNALELTYQATTQTIYVRIEDNTSGCYTIKSFNIQVYRKPRVNLFDRAICLENLPLTVSAETQFLGDTYLWSTNQTTAAIAIYDIGTYSVTVTSENGCTTTAFFDVYESEPATIESIEQVDFGNPNSITVHVSGDGNYVFALDGGEPQESNFFNYVSPGLHTVTIIDLNGCTSISREVFIIDTPLFVTPNNDGYFDTWHIIGIEQLPGTIVYIFDRYGKLLTTLNHTSLGWDGTYNGHNMPSNDYWYVAKVVKDEKEFELKGHFTLKR